MQRYSDGISGGMTVPCRGRIIRSWYMEQNNAINTSLTLSDTACIRSSMKVAKPSLSHSSVQSIAPIERPNQEWPISCARHGARLPSPAIREHWSWYSYRNHCHNILKVHSNQYLEIMNLKIPFIRILFVLDVAHAQHLLQPGPIPHWTHDLQFGRGVRNLRFQRPVT